MSRARSSAVRHASGVGRSWGLSSQSSRSLPISGRATGCPADSTTRLVAAATSRISRSAISGVSPLRSAGVSAPSSHRRS